MVEAPFSPAADRYENGMQYARCGRSGVLLSRFSLGFWHNFGAENSFRTAQEMMRYAFDHGITSFDLANNYGPPYGSAEETFGRLMEKDFSPFRDEMFLSTKAGHDMWPGPYGNWGSRKHLFASLHQSLRRMKVEYVDVFYSHRYDPDTPLEETMQALVDVVKQGKALYVGLSKYPYDVAVRAYRYLREHDTPCLLYQGKLSMLNRAPIEEGILRQSFEEGAGFVAFSPLAQGLLTNRYLDGIVPEDSRMAQDHFLKRASLTPGLLEKLHLLAGLARDRSQSLAQLALMWVLQHEEVTSVVIGASSVKQLRENLEATMFPPLDMEELEYISRILNEEL